MKPLRPGRPSEPRTKKRVKPAATGSGLASVPMAAISRVWVRSYTKPTRRKSAPVSTP